MKTHKPQSQRRRTGRWVRAGAGIAVLGSLAAITTALPAEGDGWGATAVLRDATGARVGTVKFDGDRHGTTVKVVLTGIDVGRDTFHGLHVHANDNKVPCDATTGFTKVLGHWNPSGSAHGHHRGDLPSVLVQADGSGNARSVTDRFRPAALAGKAVILHAGPDNLANIPDRYSAGVPPVAGPDDTTKGTGDSGGRIACGIVVVD